MKRAPSSASTSEYATNLMMLQRVYIAPFRRMSALSCGINPRKKCIAAWLLAPLSEAYDESELMLRTISDA